MSFRLRYIININIIIFSAFVQLKYKHIVYTRRYGVLKPRFGFLTVLQITLTLHYRIMFYLPCVIYIHTRIFKKINKKTKQIEITYILRAYTRSEICVTGVMQTFRSSQTRSTAEYDTTANESSQLRARTR